MPYYTWPVGSDITARVNLDEQAARDGYWDAHELDGEFTQEALTRYANHPVDLTFEQHTHPETLTDDLEEYRVRYVNAYVQSFLKTRKDMRHTDARE